MNPRPTTPDTHGGFIEEFERIVAESRPGRMTTTFYSKDRPIQEIIAETVAEHRRRDDCD